MIHVKCVYPDLSFADNIGILIGCAAVSRRDRTIESGSQLAYGAADEQPNQAMVLKELLDE